MEPTDKQKLDALIVERDKILEEKPHLKELQKEVNRRLDACTSQLDRLHVINIMMSESANTLSIEWARMRNMLENMKKDLL